jgi:hypothetical protein
MSERLNGMDMYSSAGIIAEPSEYRFKGMSKQEMAESRYFVERPRLRLSDPACAGKDMTLWIDPASPASFDNALKQNKVALDICRGCPVRLGCLQWALSNEECGLWGGVIEMERIDAIANGISAEELIKLDTERVQHRGEFAVRAAFPRSPGSAVDRAYERRYGKRPG